MDTFCPAFRQAWARELVFVTLLEVGFLLLVAARISPAPHQSVDTAGAWATNRVRGLYPESCVQGIRPLRARSGCHRGSPRATLVEERDWYRNACENQNVLRRLSQYRLGFEPAAQAQYPDDQKQSRATYESYSLRLHFHPPCMGLCGFGCGTPAYPSLAKLRVWFIHHTLRTVGGLSHFGVGWRDKPSPRRRLTLAPRRPRAEGQERPKP